MLTQLTRDELLAHKLKFKYPCHGEGRPLFRMVRVEKCGPDYIQCENIPIDGVKPPARPYSTFNLSKIVGDVEVIGYNGGANEYVSPNDILTESDNDWTNTP